MINITLFRSLVEPSKGPSKEPLFQLFRPAHLVTWSALYSGWEVDPKYGVYQALLKEPLWPFVVGIWYISEGSWGV